MVTKVCYWPPGMVSPGVPAVNTVKLDITTKPELLNLMANEFHQQGHRTFVKDEVENFIKRLTPEQIYLLFYKKNRQGTRYIVPENRLTTFITYGDGRIDRFMAGDLNLDFKRGPTNIDDRDNARPNASFAVFFKTISPTGVPVVELAFYTRFFVISYAGLKESNAKAARRICRQKNYDSLSSTEKADVFKYMRRMLTTKQFDDVTAIRPTRYQIQIQNINHQYFGASYIPYMMLRDRNLSTPWWFMGGTKHNTIHSIVNTRGCWMLLRNRVWNWPNEESDYTDLVKVYIKDRIEQAKWDFNIPAQYASYERNFKDLLKPIQSKLDAPDIPYGEPGPDTKYTDMPLFERYAKRFDWWGQNSSYIPMLKHLAGIEYDLSLADMFYYPNRPAPGLNSFYKQNSVKWINNIYSVKAHSNGSWCDLYLFRRSDRFTKDSGDTDVFK